MPSSDGSVVTTPILVRQTDQTQCCMTAGYAPGRTGRPPPAAVSQGLSTQHPEIYTYSTGHDVAAMVTQGQRPSTRKIYDSRIRRLGTNMVFVQPTHPEQR